MKRIILTTVLFFAMLILWNCKEEPEPVNPKYGVSISSGPQGTVVPSGNISVEAGDLQIDVTSKLGYVSSLSLNGEVVSPTSVVAHKVIYNDEEVGSFEITDSYIYNYKLHISKDSKVQIDFVPNWDYNLYGKNWVKTKWEAWYPSNPDGSRVTVDRSSPNFVYGKTIFRDNGVFDQYKNNGNLSARTAFDTSKKDSIIVGINSRGSFGVMLLSADKLVTRTKSWVIDTEDPTDYSFVQETYSAVVSK